MDQITTIKISDGPGVMGPDGLPLVVRMNDTNLVSPLKDAEKVALKESVQINGVKVPVTISLGPTRGRIIDGFNRLHICQELNMSCPLIFDEFKTVEEEDAMALGMNVQRRQLDELSAGLINIQLLELRGVHRGRRAINGTTVDDVAREAGQSRRTFYRRIEFAKLLSRPDCQDIREEYLKEELTVTEALNLARAVKKAVDAGEPIPPRKSAHSLKEMVKQLRERKLSPLEQARMEAFTEGLKWAYSAVLQKDPDPEWALQQLDSWRVATADREKKKEKPPVEEVVVHDGSADEAQEPEV